MIDLAKAYGDPNFGIKHWLQSLFTFEFAEEVPRLELGLESIFFLVSSISPRSGRDPNPDDDHNPDPDFEGTNC